MGLFGLILWGALTAGAWNRGWKAWALIPFGITVVTDVGLVIFYSAVIESVIPAIIIVSVASLVALIVMVIVKPRKKLEAIPSSSIASIAPVPGSPNYPQVSVQPPTEITPATVVSSQGKLSMPDGSEIPLGEIKSYFGRHDFGRYVPQDSLNVISRQHIMIKSENNKFYISDENSTNGTKLNGIDIKGMGWQELKDRDRIEIAGMLTFTFQVD